MELDNQQLHSEEDILEKLISRFNEGNHSAWKFIMESYSERMITVGIHIQLSLQMDIDVAQAEDITQEAWTILYGRCLEQKNHFDNIGQIIKWIRETQGYLLKNHRRKASTRYEKPIQEDDNGETLLPSEVLEQQNPRPVEDTMIRREDSSHVWSIFDQMLGEFDTTDQEIITRRIILDEAPRSIAQSVGKPIDHVYRVTERARIKLKNYGEAESLFRQMAEIVKSRPKKK